MTRVQPSNKLSYRSLILIRQPTKLNSKSVRCRMMNYFRSHRQRIFAVQQQQAKLIAYLYVRTRRQVRYAQTAEADVLRLTEA